MCGICGFISRQDIGLEQLKRMNDRMYHRGPDDSGEEIYPWQGGYAIGLAQRRLSVMDISGLGHQPMHAAGRQISVVFNGEIYNFSDLKSQLTEYPFRTGCDTEVLIAAYLRWGIECVHQFNGMFSFALWDRRSGDFYLARDRIGKKPLYYQWEENNLYFASELKPLMVRPGFRKNLRREVISRYLYQQYICDPDSVFEGVYKLPPGSILQGSVKNDGHCAITLRKYWDIKTAYENGQNDPVVQYEQAKKELKTLLQKAVVARMHADVPVGTFLSGGYDSSLVTAIAAAQTSGPVKTFSIGFHEERYDEAKYAKKIADYLGTDHTEIYITQQDMLDLVESIPQFYDEPFADSSQIPTMLVSKAASLDVKVALSGDGGDEFFCGYQIYEKLRQAQLLDLPGRLIHTLYSLPGVRRLKWRERLPFRVRVVAENRSPETKVQFGAGSYMSAAEGMVLRAHLSDPLSCNYPVESRYRADNWQIRRMLLDMDTYLPADILCKVDRASMKYSLEARCPILDKDVMEYSFRMDHGFKYVKGNPKRILKDIAYDYIPRELLDRPKSGFAVPLDQWLRGPLKQQLMDMSDGAYLKRQGIFDAVYTTALIENYMRTGDGGPASGANYSRLIWAFYTFQQWYQSYIA